MNTARKIILRLCECLLTALLVSIFTFAAFSVIPGDAANVMLGPDAQREQIENLREQLGLNEPLIIRYISWIKGALTGDLGVSTSFGAPVSKLIASRLPVTLGMSFIALIFVILISFPLAALCSVKPGRITDRTLSAIGHIFFAIPPFALSMMMILLLASLFGIYTAGNYTAPSVNFGKYISGLLLPSFCIALPKIAMTFKFLRAAMIEYLSSDFTRTARSHGLSDFKVLIKHIIPNSAVSSISVISLVLTDIMGGSLIVEQVFNLPGLGRLLLSSVSRRDFPLLSGIVLYLALITVFLYFASDLISMMIDPRIRDGKSA